MSDFAIAIISGLIVWAISILLAFFWRGSVLPWIKGLIHDVPRVEGDWSGVWTTHSGASSRESITLKRIGNRIYGTIKSVSGTDAGGTYDFEGTIRNLIMTATYTSPDASKLDRGSFTMMLKEDGTMFEGTCAYYSNHRTTIDAYVSYTWTRSGSAT